MPLEPGSVLKNFTTSPRPQTFPRSELSPPLVTTPNVFAAEIHTISKSYVPNIGAFIAGRTPLDTGPAPAPRTTISTDTPLSPRKPLLNLTKSKLPALLAVYPSTTTTLPGATVLLTDILATAKRTSKRKRALNPISPMTPDITTSMAKKTETLTEKTDVYPPAAQLL